MKHILSIVKISEMVFGRVKSAMELISEQEAGVFWFTHNIDHSFSFVINANNIRFSNLGEVNEE